MVPDIKAFFDEDTNTVSYVVADKKSKICAVIDPVLDFDFHSGKTATNSADAIIDYISRENYQTDWILETHAHADHLTASAYLREKLGGKVAIGARIVDVQRIFAEVFNLASDFATDGSQFDYLFDNLEKFKIGKLSAHVIHTPGHTPACLTYVIGDAAFVGDTLFMPDYGTARCDFPGGDAATLYQSIQKIYRLKPNTRLFMCHDYKSPTRNNYAWETTVGEQRERNVHIRTGTSEDAFIQMRQDRDSGLPPPRLIIPSIQVNIRAGEFPPMESNGVSYLKIPLNKF
ncbi:MAG: MBL fold metallo-hydrolase [Marinicaulis sp.]|nr:MBL fold metallo-hydrolase [Marinicaulis sp.]NNL87677.1 MBL fold metallo-hydrolase [Marinicaulis sp.]